MIWTWDTEGHFMTYEKYMTSFFKNKQQIKDRIFGIYLRNLENSPASLGKLTKLRKLSKNIHQDFNKRKKVNILPILVLKSKIQLENNL